LLREERAKVRGNFDEKGRVDEVKTHDDVVSEGILYERKSVVSDLGDELDPLRVGSVVDTSLKDAASVSVGGDLDAVSRDGVVDELVILGNETVEALLDNVVSVEILDERHDVGGESHDDGVDLAMKKGGRREVSEEVLRRTWSQRGGKLTCRGVERKSIIFWTARVPCMLSEMETRSSATDSQMAFRCSSDENSRSFWQR